MRIAESNWRKAIATLGVVTAFVSLYQATTRDSRTAAGEITAVQSDAEGGETMAVACCRLRFL